MILNKKELTLCLTDELTTQQYNHRKTTPLVKGAFSGLFFAYCLAVLETRTDEDACTSVKIAVGAVSAVRSSGWVPPTSGHYAYSPQTAIYPVPRSTSNISLSSLYFFLVSFTVLLNSCKQEPVSYPAPQPQGFVQMIIPEDNPMTEEGIALGRALFFDPILSQDSTVSCGTCHQPALAFTDGGAVSTGIEGQQGQRSAPSLLNIGFHYKGVFWDGRSPSLEEQALHPLGDSLEMGTNWPLIQERLRRHPDYRNRFEDAFPGHKIDQGQTAKALAQFQRTLVSADSKFDQVMRGEQQFTTEEQRGWTIFFDAGYPETPMAECSHCHSDPLFTNLAFSNNGLDSSLTLTDFPDLGLGKISGNKYDNGKFRVPTLRNIMITAPYMHDGRFTNIGEVIQHYNTGGAYAENVDPNVRPLQLSEQDQKDLIAFLHTLTDSFALNNQAYYPITN